MEQKVRDTRLQFSQPEDEKQKILAKKESELHEMMKESEVIGTRAAKLVEDVKKLREKWKSGSFSLNELLREAQGLSQVAQGLKTGV